MPRGYGISTPRINPADQPQHSRPAPQTVVDRPQRRAAQRHD
jgi:hypothetical protein